MAAKNTFQVHREVYQSRLNLSDDPDATQYQAISGLAVAGLLAGLLSLLAFASPLLWVLAVVAVMVNVKALRWVAANAPALLGRKAALTGLALSVFTVFAIPVDWLLYRAFLRQEARQFAELWFDYLRTDHPLLAHQLTVAPSMRGRLDDRKLWESYQDIEARQMLRQYLARPEVRTLLALGDRAIVRYYATESQWADGPRDRVYQTFAVTFPDTDGLKTFFVGLSMQREVDLPTRHAYWQVVASAGGVKPKRLGGDGAPPSF